MKTVSRAASLALAAVLVAGCTYTTVTKRTLVTDDSTGQSAGDAERTVEAQSSATTGTTTQQSSTPDSTSAGASATTAVEHSDGSEATREERRTEIAPDGTISHKRTTTTTPQ